MRYTAIFIAPLFIVGFQAHAQSIETNSIETKTELRSEGDPDRPLTTGRIENTSTSTAEPGERVMQPEFGTDSKEGVDKAVPKLQELSGKGESFPDDDDDDDDSAQYKESDLDFLRRNAVRVQAVEVRGWDSDKKEEFLSTVKTESEVRSGEDLENFAKGVLAEDERVDSITIEEEVTRVSYAFPARFLGIFDAPLPVRVDADATGRVKVRYPWYSFFFKKYVAAGELAAELETAVPEVDDEVLVSFEHRARMVQAISTTLRVAHDTARNIISNVR